MYAQDGTNTIACHGNTTVYANHQDHLSNCTTVIYTNSSHDPAGKVHAAKKSGKKHKKDKKHKARRA